MDQPLDRFLPPSDSSDCDEQERIAEERGEAKFEAEHNGDNEL